ncbi:type II toxin-antitoxin system Phd/YefM family antitoxin [Streptomyces albipurpureus]|uniref:Antitoxin n=1 Tax=Streptomyces albipurpureus TaxID=2897419 RepID=A0ABT0UWX2_9ACTN|nr:type II toxin-antitoxin system Phd/YefM family antitoxin [Streptomyces sp. CWNU-1]MCM2391676.1 type II toxin-antitoxin system Phd/YefM family antitoxin [Streptomyces sp. CWNU-1]
MAYEIPVTQARAELAELINRVVYGGERVVVTRHGKPLVALVSASDLERLEQERAEQETVADQAVSAVSSVSTAGTAALGRGGFGLTSEHRRPGPHG